jgi:hypothetical protein
MREIGKVAVNEDKVPQQKLFSFKVKTVSVGMLQSFMN